jgi:hypothetical protein
LSDDDRRARQILIARGLDNAWRAQVERKATQAEIATIREAIELRANPSDADLAWARAQVRARAATGSKPFDHPLDDPLQGIAIVLCSASTAWCALALVFAFAFRGGLSLTVFNVLVRDKRGKRASRLRCVARTLSAALPMSAVYWAPVLLIQLGSPAAAWLAIGLAILFHAAWIAQALARPTRSLQDAIAGTRLVPR